LSFLQIDNFQLSKPYSLKELSGVLEIAREVFVEEIISAVPEDRNPADDAESRGDPDTDLCENLEVCQKSGCQVLPYKTRVNFQDKHESQKHEGEQFHESIETAHEPAGGEKEREFRAHHTLLAKGSLSFSAEGQTPDGIDQEAPADEYNGHPKTDHAQSGEVDPVDMLDDPIPRYIEKRAKIAGYAQFAGHITVQRIHVEDDDHQEKGCHSKIKAHLVQDKRHNRQDDPCQGDDVCAHGPSSIDLHYTLILRIFHLSPVARCQ